MAESQGINVNLGGILEDQEKSISYYQKALSQVLPAEAFKLNPYRLIWYILCVSGTVFGVAAVANLELHWTAKSAVGLLIGACNGTLGFICHEILHGAVIRNRKLQVFLSFFGAAPFFISPTFWKYWHNVLHHGKTQQLIRDPDAFPNLKIYKASKFMKFMFPFTPGSGHKRSIAYFFFWFSFHNFVAQVYLRFRNKLFESLDHMQVNMEFVGQVIVAIAIAVWVGPANWVFVFLIPLFIQNYILMSYISTNHNLSPLTNTNDPLINSLTVTNHPVLEFLNLNFGYHVEHHIFPAMSGAYTPLVHRELKRLYPDKIQVMPKWKAMKALYQTSRIYKSSHMLINPETGRTYDTIGSKPSPIIVESESPLPVERPAEL
ncbi:MAG: fatty acid desaturase [Oligoflexia bacterium]|nr:fatty acid desaturase [Oligoflexia bacterium]